ncbi:hypothetical protein A2392_01195 [Candidatus Kaiserbacteria bacterium RIFOXYB1_FULL_46_14]|uniref:peptide chain release factor N(5)-glutamine methyltransferase n=1 Tax=Candidatus Kaiserbacteria bacterium RIFOXYB1_FULL_46_14 TaxID=1798531 RepID=A0A1F6FJP2_9BACT|nr:MAG: hypothetical protein A2392_01195 [Candidatus Kaiserbacteria bacterium RIFOXYB1_FULL_46_14]
MDQSEEWLLKEKYNGEKCEAFFADLKRLTAGEPLGYVIGHAPFLNCKIFLDSHPLIPRPETEYWVEKAIKEIEKAGKASPRPLRILDLCAGSGAIGVAVAKAVPSAEVTFVEIDPSHLPTIEKNITQNLSINRKVLGERFVVIESDLFSKVEGEFDFILTNPPYIDPAIDRTEENVKNFEPHLALYGGVNGVELIARLIAEAPQYLSDNGQLWIEHEPEQTEMISKLAFDNLGSIQTLPDQYGIERYSILNFKPDNLIIGTYPIEPRR